MTLDIQFKLKSNPNYTKYLRENSNWYKTLNRNPASFSDFEDEMKEKYQLRPTDRISKALNAIEMIQAIMGAMK